MNWEWRGIGWPKPPLKEGKRGKKSARKSERDRRGEKEREVGKRDTCSNSVTDTARYDTHGQRGSSCSTSHHRISRGNTRSYFKYKVRVNEIGRERRGEEGKGRRREVRG